MVRAGGAIAYRDPSHLPLVLLGLTATGILIWYLKGRAWAYVYVALIPFLNWTFGRPDIPMADLSDLLGPVFGSAPPALPTMRSMHRNC